MKRKWMLLSAGLFSVTALSSAFATSNNTAAEPGMYQHMQTQHQQMRQDAQVIVNEPDQAKRQVMLDAQIARMQTYMDRLSGHGRSIKWTRAYDEA